MASVKNLKSKNRALPQEPGFPGINHDYVLRKQQFADTPPAKVVRPLRVVRYRFEQALRLWDRSIVKGIATTPYPYFAEQLYHAASRAAKRGDGALVRLAAA